MRLSAVVLAKNEESRIAKCLESLAFCDEIIVIDNGSTDKTCEIAQRHKALVHEVKEKNFSSLRNAGKDKAKGTWILYVDADEIVTEELKREIIQKINDKGLRMKDSDANNESLIINPSSLINGYYIPRRNYYLGYDWPVRDKMQRLFLKEALIRWEGKLHETAIVDGKMGELHEPLIHNTHRTLEEMVEKTNEWSRCEAQLRFDVRHPKVTWWRLIRVMVTGFFQSFIREGGWRIGTVGWIESIYQAFSMFITYAKLWELQEKKRKSI